MLADLHEAQPSHIGAVRQCGFVAGIDLVKNAATGTPFRWQDQMGARVCLAAREHGLLTRPIVDTVALMLPLCSSTAQIEQAVSAIGSALQEICG